MEIRIFPSWRSEHCSARREKCVTESRATVNQTKWTNSRVRGIDNLIAIANKEILHQHIFQVLVHTGHLDVEYILEEKELIDDIVRHLTHTSKITNWSSFHNTHFDSTMLFMVTTRDIT